MTLIRNVEVLSNIAEKTIGYEIGFNGKRHQIKPVDAHNLNKPSHLIDNLIAGFSPLKGFKLAPYDSYGLPTIVLGVEHGVTTTISIPKMKWSSRSGTTMEHLVGWVTAFNKFLDEIDALGAVDVELPTYKNIVLV